MRINGGQYTELKPYMFNERNAIANNAVYYGYAGQTGPFYRYRVQGDAIVLNPTPSAGVELKLYYTPTARLMVSGSDTIDGINGFEEFPVNYAAIECIQAEMGDTTTLERRNAQIEKRIKEMAANRNTGSPKIVASAMCDDDWF